MFAGPHDDSYIATNAVGKSGRVYPYFICAGRHANPTSCTFKATLIKTVERHVSAEYANPSHQLTKNERRELASTLSDELAAFHRDGIAEQERLRKRRDALLSERAKLLQAHLADAVPLDLLKIEQSRIREQIDGIEQRLGQLAAPQERIDRNLQQTLGLLRDAKAFYQATGDRGRRAITQALFTRLEVTETGNVDGELAEPFNTLIGYRPRRRGLSNEPLVLLTGQLSNPPERLQKALDLYRDWQSEQRPDSASSATRGEPSRGRA